jgi:hypothetical protein
MSTMTVHHDVIKGASGSWGSGLATLEFKNGGSVHSDNGPLFRALESAFGQVVTAGHTANGKGHVGKHIIWWHDDMGLTMGGFVPLADWQAKGLKVPKVGTKLEVEIPE